MKILGLGLSRTGTTSLHRALEILGYRCLHYAPDYLAGALNNPGFNFKVYDEFDAVTDIPAALFYKELSVVYPSLKFILTIRELEPWWDSVKVHYETLHAKIDNTNNTPERKVWLKEFAHKLQMYVYGNDEKSFKDAYVRHHENVDKYIPKERLLIMDITKGDDWKKLCPFLEKPIPTKKFPYENRRQVKLA